MIVWMWIKSEDECGFGTMLRLALDFAAWKDGRSMGLFFDVFVCCRIISYGSVL